MKVVDAEGSSYERLLNIAVGSSTADISIPTELSAVRIASYKVYSAEGKLVFENNDAGGELINNLPMGSVKPNAIYLLKIPTETSIQPRFWQTDFCLFREINS